VIDGRLNLLWNQRSVDVALGLPFNIASYGCLLHLLAKEAGLGEGRLIGFLGDTHIYVNHVEGIRLQIERTPKTLPQIKTEKFTSIFDWHYGDTVIENYDPHPAIKFDIAV
jgi:thymidylate synthase